MVEFCCCNIKPKSYYLLLIFLSTICYLSAFLEIHYIGLNDTQYALMATFGICILVTVVYHNIMSIAAFIHYVVWDGIKYKYCHFYAMSMHVVIYILAVFDLGFYLSFIVKPGKTKTLSTVIVSIYFVISIALLILMWFLSWKLLDLMPKLDDDTTKPIQGDAEEKDKPELGAKPEEKKNDEVKVVSST